MTEPVAAPAKTTPKKETADPTEYVILAADEQGAWIEQTGHVFARGKNAALLQFFAAHPPKPGTTTSYIATPARSFKPVKVTPQVTTTLKLEAS